MMGTLVINSWRSVRNIHCSTLFQGFSRHIFVGFARFYQIWTIPGVFPNFLEFNVDKSGRVLKVVKLKSYSKLLKIQKIGRFIPPKIYWFYFIRCTSLDCHKSFIFTEAVVRSCSVKTVLVKISQNSQESICTGVLKVGVLQLY